MGHGEPAASGDAAIDRGMRAALTAAAEGPRGANPLVGAAIVDADGRVLALGRHRGAGSDHAEIDALAQLDVAPEDAGNLTMVVTLEPCNHHGRTGPCTHAIERAGIGRVVYALSDRTDGRRGGAAWLRSCGIETRQGPGLAAATALNRRWLAAREAGRPFTSLHIAQTLDGRIAAPDGTSQWITGPQARAHAHSIRARAGAIVVGTGTVLADDPRLTARDAAGHELAEQPLRVVMGRRGVPAGAAVARDENWLQVRTHDPLAVLEEVAARGIGHVLIEGGAAIAAAFLAADLVDELWVYQAPLILGAGRPAVADLGVGTLTDALPWRLDPTGGGAVRQLGEDLLIHLEPSPRPAPDAPAGAGATTAMPSGS